MAARTAALTGAQCAGAMTAKAGSGAAARHFCFIIDQVLLFLNRSACSCAYQTVLLMVRIGAVHWCCFFEGRCQSDAPATP